MPRTVDVMSNVPFAIPVCTKIDSMEVLPAAQVPAIEMGHAY